jgi:hypothetical protein
MLDVHDMVTTDDELLAQLSWLQNFQDDNFSCLLAEHPLFKFLDETPTDITKERAVMVDPNLKILHLRLKFIEEFEPDWKYKSAYINLERLNIILFQSNPYWRSRKGHEMWWYVNYANPDSYYILRWEDLYDPRKWYLPGEPRRPEHQGKTSINTEG